MSAPFDVARLLTFLVFLISAAPVRATVPEEHVSACRGLNSELVYVAEVGTPFRHRLFQDKIDNARQAFTKAKAESDKSPQDIELLKTLLKAEEELERWIADSIEMTLAPVKIERVLRGNPPGDSFIVVQGGMTIEPGRRYAFFGENSWAALGFNFHEASLLLSAEQSARVLDASATNGDGLFYGAIDVQPADDSRNLTPLAGLGVRLTAPGYAVTVSTDAEGLFVASNVPSGFLTISPVLPDELAVVGPSPTMANVMPGRCTSMNLRAALNGRIRGRVSGRDGKPRQALTIQLYLTEPNRAMGGPYTAVTNERGEFEFRTIPPGSYLLGHEIVLPHIVMPGQVRPPKTFYPGTSDRAAAIPIVVGNATQHDGYDFVVP